MRASERRWRRKKHRRYEANRLISDTVNSWDAQYKATPLADLRAMQQWTMANSVPVDEFFPWLRRFKEQPNA